MSLEFCHDYNANISEYMSRSGKRYLKRKRIVYDFSFFNWYLVTKLKSIYQKVEIPIDVLKNACFSVYPKKINILHYLKDDYNLLTFIYNKAQVENSKPFYIPFIKDIYGKSPIHYCL